jgi:hypothetical protein
MSVREISDAQVRQRAAANAEKQALQELQTEEAARARLHQKALDAEARLQHSVEGDVAGALAQLRPLYQRRIELALGLAEVAREFWDVEAALRKQMGEACRPLDTLRLDPAAWQQLLAELRVRAGLSSQHSTLDIRLGEGEGYDVASVLLSLLTFGYVSPGRIDLPSHSMTVSRRDR